MSTPVRTGGAAPATLALEPFPDLPALAPGVAGAVQRHGTPVWIGEPEIVADRLRRLERALAEYWGPAAVAYSFKTNYLVAEAGVLRDLGAWAEVDSARDYRLARRLGHPGSEIVWNGPGKREADLRRALDEGATVHVYDGEELDAVIALAAGARAPVGVGLRVRAASDAAPESRFGFSLDRGEAEDAVQRIARSGRVRLTGLHSHVWRASDDPSLHAEACARIAAFAATLPEPLAHVDAGGGYPSHAPAPRSRPVWDARPVEEFVAAIAGALAPAFPPGADRPLLITEPGRYLVGDAILLLTRVRRVEPGDGERHVHVDASLGMLPLTHHAPNLVRAFTPALRPRGGAETPARVWGASPREDDLLLEGPLPACAAGDLLAFYAAGAYNSSLAASFVLDPPPLALV